MFVNVRSVRISMNSKSLTLSSSEHLYGCFRRNGCTISVDFSLFVLLYDTFINKFIFDLLFKLKNNLID